MTVVTLTEGSRAGDGAFELAVQFEGEGGYTVSVSDPLAESSDGEQLLAWYFEEHLRHPFLDKDRERAAVELIESYGTSLFEQVFEANSEGAYAFRKARDKGLDDFRIEVIGSADLQRLHWEAIREPGPGVPLGARVPIMRRVADVAAGFEVGPQGPTLNVLLVTARPHGARDVGYRTISRPLLTALRQAKIPVSIDLVRPGSWQALVKHLQAVTRDRGSGWYRIVHFDVHGALLGSDGEGGAPASDYLLAGATASGAEKDSAYLFFEAPEVGKAEPVPTTDVAELLVEHRVPVAVLNACQSAMQAKGSEASLAQRLVEAGVPVAVGMAYSVTVTAAQLMMPVVYRCLSEGTDVLRAIQAGRRELFDDRGRHVYFDQDLDLEDWVLPVVFAQRPVELLPGPVTHEEAERLYAEQAKLLNEPEPEYGFVGRDLDVQEIERRLLGADTHNELLISGMAGTGKSTLLAHLAWWWQATGVAKRVFFFSYEERAWTVDQILQSIIVDLFDENERALVQALSREAQLGRVSTAMRSERSLLILDNAESITATPESIPHSLPEEEQVGLRSFLNGLQGGRTLVLIGSRGAEEWLAGSTFKSNLYELGGLDPQATSVLVDRIVRRHGGSLPSGEAEQLALEKLVEVLRGYPLALTVVLPAVVSSAPSEILAELKSGGLGADPAKVIHRALDFSYGRLDETTQRSLLVFAPFIGVVPRGAIPLYEELLGKHEPVRSLGELDLANALEQAIGVGLASADPQTKDHIRTHPLFPYFLRARLADHPGLAEALASAHCELYQTLAKSLHSFLINREPDVRRGGRVLTGVEYANLTSALDHACTSAKPLRSIVQALDEYLDQTHQAPARQQLLELGIGALDGTDRKFELATLRNLAGVAAIDRHNLDEARAHHESELALRVELEDAFGEGVAHHQLGNVALEQHDLKEARPHYEKALEIFTGLDDRYQTADIYHQLGILAEEEEQLEEAKAHYETALEIFAEFEVRHASLHSHHQLGNVLLRKEEPEEAEGHYVEALELAREFDNRLAASNILHQLGSVALFKKDLGSAEEYYKQALEEKLELGDRYSAANTYHQLGVLARRQKRLTEAKAHSIKAFEVLMEFEDAQGAERALCQLSLVLSDADRLPEAIACALRALFVGAQGSGELSTIPLSLLHHQRELAGVDDFREAILKVASEEVLTWLESLLDQGEATD